MKEGITERINYEKYSLDEIQNPVALRVLINDHLISDLSKVAFMINKGGVPFFRDNGLLYLPEHFISTERIKDMNEDFLGIPKDANKYYISKIKIKKDGIGDERVEDFCTLAYIAYLGFGDDKKYEIAYDHVGSLYLYDKSKIRGNKAVKTKWTYYSFCGIVKPVER